MDEAEWATYLSLQQAGPRLSAHNGVRPRPWGRGVVEEPVLEGSASAGALRDLLLTRRSSRELMYPLDLARLHALLGVVLGAVPGQPGRRRYPTSGGCDELGVLVVARSVGGVEPGAYWAASHADRTLHWAAPLDARFARFEACYAPFLGMSPEKPPAATLLIFAAWERLSARYEHCVLASALWDSGALLQTLTLAAGALDIRACICACIQPVLLEAWLDLSCREVGHIGTLALGGNEPGEIHA